MLSLIWDAHPNDPGNQRAREDAAMSDQPPTTPVTAKLPNGAVVRLAIPRGRGAVAQDVGAATPVFDMERVGHAIEGVGDLIAGALAKIKPSKTVVEFGFNFDVESGKVTAMFVNGKASADLKITLEWSAEGHSD